jgi:uncharacterized glyoxalase superfamily metalloenzyme YdcJ
VKVFIIKDISMKLRTLIEEKPKRKLKMIVTETQFRSLAENVIQLQEQKQIKNTYLIKRTNNEKKK